MKKITLGLSISFMVLSLAACGYFGSPISSEDNISTIVAATVSASGGKAIAQTPAGGEAATATTGSAASAPVSSPIRVSFVTSARNLFIWSDGTATPVQLTTSGDVVESHISSDGSLVAFTRTTDFTNYQIDVINSDGTGQRTLVSSAALAGLPRPSEALAMIPNQFDWIPGSHTLAYNLRIQFQGPGLALNDPLYLVNGDTGAVTTLLSVGQSWRFTYSPDGTKVLISKSQGIDLYNASGTLIAANVITHDLVNTASEYEWVSQPTWKADSSAFAVAIAPAQPWGDAAAASRVYVVSNLGSIISSSLTSIMQFPYAMASFNPTITRLAYTSPVGALSDNTWALHVSGIDGSGGTVLNTGYIHILPLWSPDGNYFVYALDTGTTTTTYLVTDSGIATVLGSISTPLAVRWIDGSRFVISNRAGSATSLLLGSTTGGFSTIYSDTGPTDTQTLNFDVNR